MIEYQGHQWPQRHLDDEAALLVRGDSARLRQVFGSLLTNAVKYTPTGGEVRITLRQDGAYAEIEVADTGSGITAEFLPHVFALFEQHDVGTRRRSGGLGLGLGLAIVKQLVDLHSGEIRLASEGEGRGTQAYVRLPLPGVTAGGRRAPQARLPAPALRDLRVLVVEDDAQARETLTALLRDAEAMVLAVATADEALGAVASERFDVLVSDLGLPDIDGLELIRRIRAMGLDEDALPALALTAFAGAEDRAQVLRAGFQAHVAKPARHEEVCTAIAQLTRTIAAG